MEFVKLIWVVNFFFFALILFFIWSKILIISKRLGILQQVLSSIDSLKQETRPADEKQPSAPKT